MSTHLGTQIARAVRKNHRFHAYGGWELTAFIDSSTGKAHDDLRLLTYLMAGMHADSGATLKLVEVEIYSPHFNTYEYLFGVTNGSIPPSGKEHTDVDCKVRVTHITEIKGA